MGSSDRPMDGSICLLDLRRIREKVERLRSRRSCVSVEMRTFFYAHDEHVEEIISIWDEETHSHYFARTLGEADTIFRHLKKGDHHELERWKDSRSSS